MSKERDLEELKRKYLSQKKHYEQAQENLGEAKRMLENVYLEVSETTHQFLKEMQADTEAFSELSQINETLLGYVQTAYKDEYYKLEREWEEYQSEYRKKQRNGDELR